MAVTNYNKKCVNCGGNKWEYLKELKMWRCRYCGGQVERQEQYDGLYTIKNVVRQVILDSAYRKMDQAERNLSECQKINAQYAGTLIASICSHMIAAVSGISMAGQDPRSMLGQIKRDYMQLINESKDLSDDETVLYEFLDSSDAWAVLATVFHTLGDDQRRDYLLTLIDPQQVFSKETNKSLLSFAVKANQLSLAEKILETTDNVDIQDALMTVLHSCPDGAEKLRMGTRLLESGALKAGEESELETYFSGSDSVLTKGAFACAASNLGVALSMDVLLREVMSQLDMDMLRQLLAALFKRRLYDGEVELLMGFAANQQDGQRACAVLETLVASDQFISLNARQAETFLCNTSANIQLRLEILDKLKAFTCADRMWETVAGSYLCKANESYENRSAMLQGLYQLTAIIPAKIFENYVLTSTLDGEKKAERIREILNLSGMVPGFFRELTGKYLRSNQDTPACKQAVLLQLMDCGIALDGSALIDYICKSEESGNQKVELIQTALRSGTTLRGDALSIYLEQCSDSFSPELFSLLYQSAASVTQKALENYVLRCKDAPTVKVRNASVLASRTGMSLGSGNCTIHWQGMNVNCSLAQAYLLTTDDDIGLATGMVQAMTQSGTRLANPVQIGAAQKKFNRFVQENRGKLSSVAERICDEHRLFARFF